MFARCTGASEYVDRINQVNIGKQVWMTENLNVDKFRNGEPILEAKTDKEWNDAIKNRMPAWSYYNNSSVTGDRCGKLYNWYAINDPRGLAPEGWKIPTSDDWERLADYLGGKGISGIKMKSIDFWEEYGGGTNAIGFNGIPCGCRNFINENFSFISSMGLWWSTSINDSNSVMVYILNSKNDAFVYLGMGMNSGYSVRCLRNN